MLVCLFAVDDAVNDRFVIRYLEKYTIIADAEAVFSGMWHSRGPEEFPALLTNCS